MKKFAQLLNTLFFTYRNIDKMRLIQRYLQETPDPDRGYALAIIANTLNFPTFKRALIKELIQEKIDPALFEMSYDYVGDISETIALLWPPSMEVGSLPLLSHLINTFNNLTKNDIKLYLESLLNRSTVVERWALLKLGTSNLRIGISARFLKKTLANYGQVHIQDIEEVWHSLQVPYSELFDWLENRIPKPLVTHGLTFHPVMLSHPLEEKDIERFNMDHYAIEKKYDGIRVQLVVTPEGKALYSRTGEDISHSFPDILKLVDTPIVLDGELVIIKDKQIGSFNELQQRLNRKSLSKKLLIDRPAGLVVYDLLTFDQEDLRHLIFSQRRTKLEEWVAFQNSPQIVLSHLLILNQQQNLEDLKQQVLGENHPAVEGLMIKRKDSTYIAGRPKGYWYKWKRNPYVVDAVLMYAQRGHGRRSSYYSDYTFGLWNNGQLVPIGKAYFGFTDQELHQLDGWIRHHTQQRFGPVREVAKELVFEVAFDAVNLSTRHKSGIALRFPRIKRIRWDKPAHEADRLETLFCLIKSSRTQTNLSWGSK